MEINRSQSRRTSLLKAKDPSRKVIAPPSNVDPVLSHGQQDERNCTLAKNENATLAKNTCRENETTCRENETTCFSDETTCSIVTWVIDDLISRIIPASPEVNQQVAPEPEDERQIVQQPPRSCQSDRI